MHNDWLCVLFAMLSNSQSMWFVCSPLASYSKMNLSRCLFLSLFFFLVSKLCMCCTQLQSIGLHVYWTSTVTTVTCDSLSDCQPTDIICACRFCLRLYNTLYHWARALLLSFTTILSHSLIWVFTEPNRSCEWRADETKHQTITFVSIFTSDQMFNQHCYTPHTHGVRYTCANFWILAKIWVLSNIWILFCILVQLLFTFGWKCNEQNENIFFGSNSLNGVAFKQIFTSWNIIQWIKLFCWAIKFCISHR